MCAEGNQKFRIDHFEFVANTRVELRRPAKFEGTIETPVLVVEEGVVMNGNLAMPGKGSSAVSAVESKAE